MITSKHSAFLLEHTCAWVDREMEYRWLLTHLQKARRQESPKSICKTGSHYLYVSSKAMPELVVSRLPSEHFSRLND